MSETFNYRPKFVDIRVNKKPRMKVAQSPQAQERACDQIGCQSPGEHRAPKARGRDNEWWWFCAAHVAEYNRRWNYFDGMNDAELAAFEAAERAGHRPTWTFRAAKGDRLSGVFRDQKASARADPFGMFNADGAPEVPTAPRRRSLGRLQILALETLGLDERASVETVRATYADLVKRYHPDSNGGDRTMESHLHKVIKAYQTLKNSGLV
ncbi:MAG: J domain-containing protein [Hyphomonadaceae bacterium]|nr:J domain-containing protein [Hyphomonadaceae bacterium]